jgi:hypothetical protein
MKSPRNSSSQYRGTAVRHAVLAEVLRAAHGEAIAVPAAAYGAAALKPTPPAPSGADAIGLKAGDDVRHGKFGEGVILAIEGAGDKAEAVVRFPGFGEKRLLLAWAPLEKC